MFMRNENPMCYMDLEELEQGDYESVKEDDYEVTYYSDGTTTYHFGGPGGSMSYDEFGEEC